MQLNFTMFAQAVIIIMLVSAMFYILRELLRQNSALKADSEVHALRLQALQEKVRYQSLRATQTEQKKLNSWSGTRKFRLDEIVTEAEDICSFYLVPHDGKSLPAFDPGQHLTFRLDVPGQDRPVVRCYSLSDTPIVRERYRVTIKRLSPPLKVPAAPPGISSGYFHRVLRQGDILDCKAPGGNFYLDMAQHGPIVLIGGGIGITPIISMARSVAMSGSKRETWIFYGVKNDLHLVQGELLRALDDEHENIHVRLCFSNPTKDNIEGVDYDFAEWVSVDLLHRVLPSTNYDYYICGPGPMMNSITEGLAGAGVDEKNVHYESFGPASVKKKAPAEPRAEGEPIVKYRVNFAKSGKQLDWQADDGSLLDFAEANGITLDSGCRAGSCGTCAIAVREGSVDYLGEISAKPEDGSCLACLAIPEEKLVIDA